MDFKKIGFRDALLVVQTVLLVVLVVEVSVLLTGNEGKGQKPKRQPRKPIETSIDVDEFTKDSYFMGNKSAETTLVKFNSFSCGYCKKAREPFLKLAKNYPDKLKIVYKHFNRGNIDMNTSQAVECAGEQGKFWEMYNAIFDKGARGDLNAYAQGIGVNVGQFKQCMSTGKYKKKVMEDTLGARKLGVRASPSFLLNKTLHRGYKPYERMEELVKEAF